MKVKFLIILSMFTLFNLAACESSEDNGAQSQNDDILSIEGLVETVSAYGEYRIITITADDDWELSSDVDWITFSKESGFTSSKMSTTITVSIEFNFYDSREAKVTLATNLGEVVKTLTQPAWERPVTKYQVGDPEVTFDESAYDSSYIYYDQMLAWRDAGIEGGIPHLEDVLSKVTHTFESGATCEDIKACFENNKNDEIVVLLKNGEYHFDETIDINSNATLVGESREGVIITVGPDFDGSYVLDMSYAENVALRNVTINGAWLNEDGENYPKYDWVEELPGRDGDRTLNIGATYNSYVDNVSLLNNASHPIWLGGSNNTIRNVKIVDSFNKAGGCQGYFFIQGERNVITNCQITGIRHISFQNSSSKLNVFYDNDLEQEVTFHSSDGGDNLIEYNRVYLPPIMDGAYNAIMGPWASEHEVGGLNMIYRNKCKEDNPGRGGVTPWSDLQLYLGPYEVSVGTDNPNRYTNFSPTDASSIPAGGTLYPIILD